MIYETNNSSRNLKLKLLQKPESFLYEKDVQPINKYRNLGQGLWDCHLFTAAAA